MTSVTVELPDIVAQQVLAYPEAERNLLVAEVLQDWFADSVADVDDDLIADLREGFADLDDGRVLTRAQADSELDSAFEAMLTRHPSKPK